MISERILGRNINALYCLSLWITFTYEISSDEFIHRLDHMNNSGRLCPVVFDSESVSNLAFCFFYGSSHYRSAVFNLFGTRDQFRGIQFFHGPVGVGMGMGMGIGLGMIQMHYIYCAPYFYYYYIVIYSEIIMYLTMIQSQWEP